VGVAGALRPSIELGDVVVASQVHAYHGGTAEDDSLRARKLIEETVAHGLATTDGVHFYRLLALLSGRTLSQLDVGELDQLEPIGRRVDRADRDSDWAAGLRTVLALLGGMDPGDPDLAVKRIEELPPGPRVTEPLAEDTEAGENALDASGLPRTLEIMEGIAAEGKEWIRHRLARAARRLSDLSETIRRLVG
jgi:hypothetical protein